jgi:ketosteroid isomerase-like protein
MRYQNLLRAGFCCTVALLASPTWAADSDAVATLVADASSDSKAQLEVKAAFSRFIAAQNTHDASALSDVLARSHDFVWAQGNGKSIWGFDDALAVWKSVWKGSWHLDPQLNELRIARIAPDAAVLIAPVRLTSGDPGEQPSTDTIRWAGVFARSASGWRLSSLIVTPYPDWQKP